MEDQVPGLVFNPCNELAQKMPIKLLTVHSPFAGEAAWRSASEVHSVQPDSEKDIFIDRTFNTSLGVPEKKRSSWLWSA